MRVVGSNSVNESLVDGSKSVIFGSNEMPSNVSLSVISAVDDIVNGNCAEDADETDDDDVGNSRIMCELEPKRSGNG